MARLNITLTGICAFYPGSPDSGTTVDDVLTVVMPASKRRISSAPAGNHEIIAIHQPFIVAEHVNVTGGRDADWVSSKQKHVWILGRDRIEPSIQADRGVTFVRIPGTRGNKPAGDQSDIFWIADMRQIWPDRAAIVPDYLKRTGALGANVNAQLVLGGATVASEFREASPYPLVEFDPIKKERINHTLTRWVVLSYDLKDQVMVLLKLTSLEDGTTDHGYIELRSKDNADINIVVGNASFQDIVGVATDDITRSVEGPDVHFELYYDVLIDDGNADLTIPVIHLQSAHSNCPPLMTGSVKALHSERKVKK